MPVTTYVARGANLRALGFWPDLTPGTPPPPSGEVMLLGASGANSSLSTLGKEYAVRRSYDQGGIPASYAASAANGDFAAGRSTVWSAKPDLVAFAAGSLDAAFATFIGTIPSGTLPNGRPYQFYCNMWHEPDVKIRAGSYTAAQFRAASSRMADRIAVSGRTNIIPCLNTTSMPFSGNFTDAAHGFSSPEDFYTPGKQKVYLLDAYNLWGYSTDASMQASNQTVQSNHYNLNPWSEMVARYSTAITWFRANNVRWGIGESNATEDVNTAASQPGGLHSKATWLTNGLQACYDSGCEVYCYWDAPFASDYDPLLRRLHSSASAMTAWDAALTKYGSA